MPINLQAELLQRVRPFFRNRARWAVGYSTGPDSTALLHACVWARKRRQIVAIHIHHGLRAASDKEAALAQRVCHDLRVRLRIIHLEGKPEGNTHEWARRSRLTAFQQVVSREKLEGVLLGHHYDDAMETLTMRSPSDRQELDPHPGVGWLQPLQKIDTLTIGRPFLDVPRHKLRNLVDILGLECVDDPSNVDPRTARGQLRAQGGSTRLIPPADYLNVAKQNQPQAALEHFWRTHAAEVRKPSAHEITFSTRLLQEATLQDARRFLMWAAWGITQRLDMPPGGLAERAQSRESQRRYLIGSWNELELWHGGDEIVLWKPFLGLAAITLTAATRMMKFAGVTYLVSTVDYNRARLDFRRSRSVVCFSAPVDSSVIARPPFPGDRMRIGNTAHRKLADIFTDAGVAPWQRSASLVLEWPTVGIRAVQLGWNQRFRVSTDAYAVPTSRRILRLERLLE